MKPRALASLAAVVSLLLAACGPGPEPKSLAGESQAAEIVDGFLAALQIADFELASSFLHDDPDRILDDLPAARELFFGVPSTGRATLAQGREQYGMDWHINLDVKLNYGDKMKQLRFTLAPGVPPKIRGVNPMP